MIDRARLGTLALALAIGCTALTTTAAARAQEEPLQAANGAAIYLGSLEGVLLLSVPISAAMVATATRHSDVAVMFCFASLPLCQLVAPNTFLDALAATAIAIADALAILVVPPIFGGVGGESGWDADGSLVLTTGFNGLLEGALLGGGVTGLAGAGDEVGMLVFGLALGAAGTTYGAIRHTELTHDPRVGVEAHFLMWSPPVAMLLAGVIGAIADVPTDVGMLIAGLLGLAAQAISVGFAEAALAEPVAPLVAPLRIDGLAP